MKVANIGAARAALVIYRNAEFYFLFNGSALFAIRDRYSRDFHKLIIEDSEAGLEALLEISLILAEQGELARREIGLDKREIPAKEWWGTPTLLQPHAMNALRTGCTDAISLGYDREVTDKDEEIDLGLIELSKKKG